jgi:hypothetical protein
LLLRGKGLRTHRFFLFVYSSFWNGCSDTGNTLNSIRAKRTGEMKAKVSSGSKIAEILDNPNKLDRPFFKSVAEKFKPKFKANISETIKKAD